MRPNSPPGLKPHVILKPFTDGLKPVPFKANFYDPAFNFPYRMKKEEPKLLLLAQSLSVRT